MNTLETEWGKYKEYAVNPAAPDFQFRELKDAFFAGAGAVLAVLVHSDNRDRDIEDLKREFLRYAKDVILNGDKKSAEKTIDQLDCSEELKKALKSTLGISQ